MKAILNNAAIRGMGAFLYDTVVYLGMVFLGWGIDALPGLFAEPARLGFVGIVVGEALARGFLVGRYPLVPIPESRRHSEWDDRSRDAVGSRRLLAPDVIWVVAPFSDRRSLAVMISSGWVRWLGLALLVGAMVWILWGFAARRQHVAWVTPDSKEPLLITEGPYRWVRYPGMLGYFLCGMGVSLIFRSWIGFLWSLLLVALLTRTIARMEQDSQRRFGIQWYAYSKKTWKLIPFLY